MKEKFSIFFLYLIIFLTGAAGLIYQVAWQKYLSRLLGADSIATAVILGVFLGGLSLGYYLCGVLTTKVKNHLKAFAVLEGIIGAWCLFFPIIFQTVDSFTKSWSFSPPYLIILQGLICCIALIGIPTVCMGGAIPFLTRGISTRIEEATRVTANVYSINTAGAFIGALLAGFYLLPEYGLPLTVMGTSVINITAFLFFYIRGAYYHSEELPDTASAAPVSFANTTTGHLRTLPLALYAIAFLSGFYVMTLQNILMRLSALSLGSSSYTYSLIVAAFILSIALGSYIVGRLKILSEKVLYFNQLFIGVTLFVIYFSLDAWPYVAHLVRIVFQANIAGFWAYWLGVFSVLVMVLIIPVALMGATVPLVFHFVKKKLEDAGRHVGYVFSLNAAGNLSGSIIGGILLYYFLDIPGIFLAAVLLAGLSACLAGWYIGRRHFLSAVVFAVVSLVFIITTPFYDINHFKIGTFRLTTPQPYSFSGPEYFFDNFYGHLKLRHYEDGPTATVAVIEGTYREEFQRTNMAIIVNGKSDSDTIGDIITLKLLAHIPALLADKPRQVMLIGLGTGVTAGELTLYPEIEQIDVAEISPDIVDALKYFRESTHDVGNDRRVRLHIGDAFRLLGRTDKKYDLIISQPSNPWTTGVDLLFTSEFYQLASKRLAVGGMLLQWMHTYSADLPMVGMVLNTIRQEFKTIHVFLGNASDLLILATNREFTALDLKRAEDLLQNNTKLRSSLQELGITNIDELLLRELFTTSYIRDHFGLYGTQTTDFPRLHYLAGRSFFLNSHVPMVDLFNSSLAAYSQEYLISKKYPGWPSSDPAHLRQIMQHSHIRNLPWFTRSLRLRAYLHNPDEYPLTAGEKKDMDIDLLPLIITPVTDKNKWKDVGLDTASYREKIQILLNAERKSRNWIVPYPISGLQSLLKEGIVHGYDIHERNWCALKLTQLLIRERSELKQVNNAFASLKRDAAGEIMLEERDKDLGRVTTNLLKTYSLENK